LLCQKHPQYALIALGWQVTELLMALYKWSLSHNENLVAA
jgi:DNA-binding HxlR family transcriptional regulator